MTSDFVFRSLRPTDLFATRTLITKMSLHKEPLISHIQLSESGFNSIYNELFERLDFKTSIVAIQEHNHTDTIDHEIFACLMASPLDAQVDESKVDNAAVPILNLINDLDSWFKDNILQPRSISEKRVIHLTMGATKDEHRRKGLFKGMMSEWLNEANDERWDIAVAECASPISRHLLKNRLGWREGKVVRYETFEVGGKRPFEGLKTGAALMYKELPG